MSNTQDLTGDPAYINTLAMRRDVIETIADGGIPVVLDRQTDADQWSQTLGDEVPVIDLGASGATVDPLAGDEQA